MIRADRCEQIIIHHRGPKEKVRLVEEVFRSFKSRYVYLGYEEHDMVTANTQAVTHAAFLRWVRLRLFYTEMARVPFGDGAVTKASLTLDW
jgi:hypothetical protein